MPLSAVTASRLERLVETLPRSKARQLLRVLRPVLEVAVKKHYLRVNPALDIEIPTLRAEIEAEADREIVTDYPAQVQIAYNVAAKYRDGYFLPHIVLMYQPHLRPECEVPRVKPRQVLIEDRLLRIHSTKVNAKRLVYLTVGSAAMLAEMWDGRPLRFDGWEEFLAIMRAAQGYDVGGVPKWFAEQLPPPWMFSLWMIIDLATFAKKLFAQSNAVYAFLRAQLGDGINDALERYLATGENARELQSLLIGGLNQIVKGPSLIENAVFSDVDLSPESLELKNQKPTGAELERLNRMVLADACFELPKIPRFVSDIPRHTGRSMYVYFDEWMKVTYGAEKDRRVLKTNYDALMSKRQVAQTASLMAESLTMSTELRDQILEQLVEHKIVTDGKFPEPPIVPTFNVNPPVKRFWLPPVSDDELVKMMFQVGTVTTAKNLKTTHRWLMAIVDAKGLRRPPAGRYRTVNPEDVSPPPPLVTLSKPDLEAMLKERHGIQATAMHLGIDPTALTAYCFLNDIKTPSVRELGRWRGKQPRVKLSPQQIKVMLERGQKPEEIAQAAGPGVTAERVVRYCESRGIRIPTETAPVPPEIDLATIKELVARDLEGRNRSELQGADYLDMVLSHAPRGLQDSDIIAVLQVNDVPFTSATIRAAIHYADNGRFVRIEGRVHLLRWETDIDLDKLKVKVEHAAKGRPSCGQLDAIRFVLTQAERGLSISQLSTAIAWLGFRLEPEILLTEIRRYVAQVRLQLYRGTVTLPDTAAAFTLNTAEREPTPELAKIQNAVQNKYDALIDKDLTNVELMAFVLSHAPQGLWTDEFLAIAKSLGIAFKEWSIHSVVTKEAKGHFCRRNYRISLANPDRPFVIPRLTLEDLRRGLDGQIEIADHAPIADQAAAGKLMIDILNCFTGGLRLTEWLAAFAMFGGQTDLKSFTAKAYHLAEKGRCRIHRLRATPLTPPTPQPIP